MDITINIEPSAITSIVTGLTIIAVLITVVIVGYLASRR